MGKFMIGLVFALFVCGCGGVSTKETWQQCSPAGSDGDGGASSSTTVTAGGGDGGSGGNGGGSECVTNDDCAVKDTGCFVFTCEQGSCFVHERDDDGDGYASCADEYPGSYDCNDLDPTIHPDAAEVCTDGQDNDCDGTVDEACFTFCAGFTDPASDGLEWYEGCCPINGSFQTADTVSPGMFFTGDGTLFPNSVGIVSYLHSNGKRYVHPLMTDFVSWQAPLDALGVPIDDPAICGKVVQVPDSLFYTISIGGNVTVRPGSFVVGIIEDPKRYVVAPGGVLRLLANDAVKDALFPTSYWERVRFIPDAFFTSYKVDFNDPVVSAADYDPQATYDAANLEDELSAIWP